jgi:hypothetical protein
MQFKKSIRYQLDWKVDESNGDCIARVTRAVLYGLQPNPAEESKFQVHVSKNMLRMYPWPGQEVFKTLPKNEYEKFVAIAKAFYSGANKSKDFYYWEIPEEDTALIPRSLGSVKISDLTDKSPIGKNAYKKKARRKKGPDDIWQVTT